MDTLANNENPDEIMHYAAFHQGVHCLPRLIQPSGTEIHYTLDNSTCDPLKYKMASPILFVSICMGKSIRIQWVDNSEIITGEEDGRNLEDLEELIWDPEADISDRQIDQFLVIAR